jgi:hypothetical protein
MDAELELIFAPLKESLEARQMGARDLMELIGGFASNDSSNLAQALAFHARDIMLETNNASPYPALIAEIYRRAFFDREYAARYGTTQLLDLGLHALRDFANYLTGSLSMDDYQLAAGGGFDAPDRRH